MSLKHVSLLLAAVFAIVVAAGAASASTAGNPSLLLIRHQVHGCHAWSINGGPFKASQSIALKRGSRLTVTNNDVMPHKLVKVSGPALAFAPANLGHMGATVKITFTHAGVYRLTTKPGEDYMKGVETTGEDNVLRLTVTVT
jgi:plastocyanin